MSTAAQVMQTNFNRERVGMMQSQSGCGPSADGEGVQQALANEFVSKGRDQSLNLRGSNETMLEHGADELHVAIHFFSESPVVYPGASKWQTACFDASSRLLRQYRRGFSILRSRRHTRSSAAILGGRLWFDRQALVSIAFVQSNASPARGVRVNVVILQR